MEAPVEKKASVWETLRSKNPLLFAIILVVIAGSCNKMAHNGALDALSLAITLAALVLEVVGLLIVSASIVLTALSGVQDENDDDKAIEATKTANTSTAANRRSRTAPTPSKGE